MIGSSTPGQSAHREKFRLAALYGKIVFADPVKKAVYEEAANAQGKPAFSLTVGDFFNAPSVDEIDLSAYSGKSGDHIVVRASDDFEVAGVAVAIHNADGRVIEQGPAAADRGSWRYTSTTELAQGQPVMIEVTATDRPGNKAVKTQTKG